MQTETMKSRRSQIVVAAVIAAQIAIPAAMLSARWANEGSQPLREYPFSYQMYSSAPLVSYVGFDQAGETESLSLTGITPLVRRIDYGTQIPAILCSEHSELTHVERLIASKRPTSEDFAC